MAETTVERAGLQVAGQLADFLEGRVLPGTGIPADSFWEGTAAILARFTPENRALLHTRDALQARLDAWFAEQQGQPIDPAEQEAFLRSIGYLVDEPAPFTVDPAHVDPEIATLAGPQLVVPILNARFLLNAANARWGSLYDALYGTDAIPGEAAPGGYDRARGALVIDRARAFLDEAVPLANGSWRDWNGDGPKLADPAQLVGQAGGVAVIDDFGHNPDKIAATIATLRSQPGRLLLLFQPHGYGPLKVMRRELVAMFARALHADDLLVLPDPVYRGGTVARDVTSADIVADLAQLGAPVRHIADRADAAAYLVEQARPGDRIVVMGARDDTLSELAADMLARLG